MLGLFRLYHPVVGIGVGLYALLLRLGSWTFEQHAELPGGSGPLGCFLQEGITILLKHGFFWVHALDILLIWIQALYFNALVHKYRLLARNTYVPAIIYVSIAAWGAESPLLLQARVAELLLLGAVGKLLAVYKKERAYGDAFDVGLLISIASLIAFSWITFFVFAVVSWRALRPFMLREYVWSLLGIIIPYYLCGAYYYWQNSFPEFLVQLKEGLQFRMTVSLDGLGSGLVPAGVFVLLLLWGFYYLQGNWFRMVVSVRLGFGVVIAYLFAGLLSMMWLHSDRNWIVLPAALSMALLYSEGRNKWLPELLHGLFVGAVLFEQLG